MENIYAEFEKFGNTQNTRHFITGIELFTGNHIRMPHSFNVFTVNLFAPGF